MKYDVEYIKYDKQSDYSQISFINRVSTRFKQYDDLKNVCFINIMSLYDDSIMKSSSGTDFTICFNILWFATTDIVELIMSNQPRSKIIRKYLFDDEMERLDIYQTSRVIQIYESAGRILGRTDSVITDIYLRKSDIFSFPFEVYENVLFHLDEL